MSREGSAGLRSMTRLRSSCSIPYGRQAGAFYEDRVAKGNICHVRHERPWFVQSYRAARTGAEHRGWFQLCRGAERAEKVHFISGLYAEDEVRRDPDKGKVQGILFQGEPGKPVAVLIAGGGFDGVASYLESIPAAMELHRRDTVRLCWSTV